MFVQVYRNVANAAAVLVDTLITATPSSGIAITEHFLTKGQNEMPSGERKAPRHIKYSSQKRENMVSLTPLIVSQRPIKIHSNRRREFPRPQMWRVIMLHISRNHYRTAAISAAVLAALGGIAFAAQDKYTVAVPGGLAFSEFRGFEAWQTIGVSQGGDKIEVILGNPAMIAAYQAGIPGNGKPFPDGAKMAKIHWTATKSADAPSPTTVHGPLHDVDLMAKDSKRFADSNGWGYAQFNYVAASGTFTPLGTGYKCGTACHTLAKSKDYVFTTYGER